MQHEGSPHKPLPIEFSAVGRTWRGVLEDTPSGREVARHLPLELDARRWFGAYAGRRERALDIWLDPQPGRVARPGDLAWWPEDSSLCIYLPDTLDEDPGRPALPDEVNRIGRVEGDLTPLGLGPHLVRLRLAAAAPVPAEFVEHRGYEQSPAAAPVESTDFGNGVHVGPEVDRRGIERLARKGFRSILDLREEGEPSQTLSPNVAASWAHSEALVHLRATISRTVLDPASVERFREQLARAPRPVYVHSGTGRRAAALLAIHHALEQNASASESLEHVRSLGLDPAARALIRFVDTEVTRRQSPAAVASN